MSTAVLSIFVILLCIYVVRSDIPDYQDYGPIRRPSNPGTARDILGYDRFQTVRTGNPRYGNNWEKYDVGRSRDSGSFNVRQYNERRDYGPRSRQYDDRDYYERDGYRRQ